MRAATARPRIALAVGQGTLHLDFPEPLVMTADTTWCAWIDTAFGNFTGHALIVGATR
ncbi:MAG TPA: hypothetical protein VGX21_23160 [Methylomirabilota bacterium]|jgi:hypothetical protein|nr:hypothetical protein [Methylomirabilota bacterium]